ncbi:MAG: DUF302 domain-containing protein, partial [Pricia sp.]
MKMNLFVFLFASLLLSCGDDNTVSTDEPDDTDTTEESTSNPPNVLGMDYTQSQVSVEDTYTALRGTLEANPNISIVAEVDHMGNAASVDLELRPTRVIFFGNPNLGTPLMQKNQLAGLDLPQKILVYENEEGEVYAGFNNTTYLSTRHGLEGVETLPMIQGALTNLSTGASQDSIVAAENSTAELEEGIITKTVNGSCDEAYSRLRTAIEGNPNLRIIAELDHQANAASVDLELRPTRIIIFGNPNLGTPLMQNAQTTALDLPQKMLVWTDADGVGHVAYNDPAFLAERHGIT